MDDGDRVEIFTPVTVEGEIDYRTLLIQNCKVTVGAFAITDSGMIVFRYCLPLKDLSPAEFDTPVMIVADYADRVERVATGGQDQY
jgi:hypothetical protein